MLEKLELLIFIIPTLLLFCVGLFSRIEKRQRPSKTILFSKVSILGSFIVTILAILQIALNGQAEIEIFTLFDLGITLRIDALSIVMYAMIAILGFVVLRFSYNYLSGDDRHAVFLGRMAITIGAVQLLVLSGNLFILFFAWVLASAALHKLIMFYSGRVKARNAAKKKFIIARLSDISLLTAFTLLYFQFNTGSLSEIFLAIQNGEIMSSVLLEWSVIFLALAAIFKSAQFPTHGWLVEVMETPTPVSALLHAGLLNAGPFIIVRMAFLMDTVYYAPIILVVVGAISAFYGTIVYITQPSVKTALSYSSVAHMGFTLMTCGFGVYSAAMLHLTGHSFYKAHAFLSSGSSIEKSGANKYPNVPRKGSIIKIFAGVATSLIIYLGISYLWGFNFQQNSKLLIVGGVIVLGLSQLLVHVYDSKVNSRVLLITVLRASFLTVSFFALESLMHYILVQQLPVLSSLNTTYIVLAIFVITLFSLVILSQLFVPFINVNKSIANLGVHIRNGFYFNVYFDRLINAYKK